ncbi:MAG: aminotransferase class V-fold PLP-dependent enzyme [Bacteroidota bacterium]
MRQPLAPSSDRRLIFLEQQPDYLHTKLLDEIRSMDFKRLDKQSHVYLDFTGSGLYGESLLEQHHRFLKENVLGNPHSSNPTSQLATVHCEAARQAVLDYFQAGDDYICIFTPNASGALKIVGECYPFCQNGHFLLAYDNHNSVNGIREYAKKKGADFDYCPLRAEDLRLDAYALDQLLQGPKNKDNKLFAFPAQSNVSGVKHDLSWIEKAQSLGWDVLLDAAAFVPTNRLDLSMIKPDFVSVSYYKMFGYPTGLGSLLVRKSAFHKLVKQWFAGGTVSMVSAVVDKHELHNNHEKFENGTINFLDIPAVKMGLDMMSLIGVETVQKRVASLTRWTLAQLQAMRHQNGQPLVEIYGPKDGIKRGGTIIFNLLDPNGRVHPFYDVESAANARNISLRTGCFCNPGLDEINSCVTNEEMMRYFKYYSGPMQDHKAHFDFIGRMRGAIRISFGMISNFQDACSLVDFILPYCDQLVENIQLTKELR